MKLKPLAILVIFFFGFVGLLCAIFLPVRLFPRSDQAVIKIQTIFPGADAKTNFSSVSQVLARFLATIPGLDYIQAENVQSASTVELVLLPKSNLDRALNETIAKIQEAKLELPPEIFPPAVEVVKPDSRVADMYVSLSSDKLQTFEVAEFALKKLIPHISKIEGIQKLELLGGNLPALKFYVKGDTLHRFGTDLVQFQNLLSSIIKPQPGGFLDLGSVRLNVSIPLELNDIQTSKKFIPLKDGYASLNDFGTLKVEPENNELEARFNGKPSIFLGVFVQPTANALTVLGKVRDELEQFKNKHSFEGSISVPYDSSVFINASLKEILKTLLETILIVGVVVFVSLGSFYYGLLVCVAVPLSLLAVTLFLYFFGYSINLLTILAAVLCVGIVVDDAILVIENAITRIRNGENPAIAGVNAVRSLWKPMLVLNFSLVILFMPFFFQTGLTADLFKEFALAFITAILASLVVSLTVTPAGIPWLQKRFNYTFKDWTRLILIYRNFLKKTLKYSFASIIVLIAFACSLPVLASLVPKDFLPKEDRGVILTFVEIPKFLSPARVKEVLTEWHSVVSRVPETKHVFQIGSTSFNFGGIGLKPYKERQLSAFEVEKEVYRLATQIKSAKLVPINPPPLPSSGTFPVEIALVTPEFDLALLEICNHFLTQLRKTGLYGFLDCSPKADRPELVAKIEESKLASFGIPLNVFVRELSSVTVDRFVSIFPFDSRSYKFFVKMPEIQNVETLASVPFYFNGNQYRLGSFLSFDLKTSLDNVKQINQGFSVVLRAAPLPGVPMDTAIHTAKSAFENAILKDLSVEYLGDTRQFLRNIQESKRLYFFAIALIFALFYFYTRSFTCLLYTS
ncbi:MAG: efflux RND transporter permease subunit, partial [Deltaproteobacteria bacterium]|nr:efflux RND transporter permease subunit [Deltaproteobacteria bacterium]